MGIHDEDPEIRSLRSDLLKALRRTAFETYVQFGDGGGERRISEGHAFADAIVKAITAEVFEDAYAATLHARPTASVAGLLPSSLLLH
jgi:hypothetical protein